MVKISLTFKSVKKPGRSESRGGGSGFLFHKKVSKESRGAFCESGARLKANLVFWLR